MEEDDLISIMLESYDQRIFTSIIINKNSTITELIYLINNTLRQYYPDIYLKEEYSLLNKGKILTLDSKTLVSSKFGEGEIILLVKKYNDDDNEKEPKKFRKQKDLISLNLVSFDGFINFKIDVNIHSTCANLMDLLNKIIGFNKVYSDLLKKGVYYVHNGKKLIFNAKSLESLNFKDEDKIFIYRIEDKNIIKDDGSLINNIIREDLISIILISTDQRFMFSMIVSKKYSGKQLNMVMTTKILSEYPKYNECELRFLHKGSLLPFSSKNLEELDIKDGDCFVAMEIEPLFDEDINLDVSIIIDQENEHKISLDFNLNGLLKLCLIKDLSLYIDRDSNNYRPKITKKIKNILEMISGGNIDLNETQNSIISVLKKFEGINIVNFAKFIDVYITKEEIINILNIFKEEDKTKIQEEISCLTNYSDYMELFEKEFELAKKKSVFEWRITSMTIVDRSQLKDFETAKKECPNRQDRLLFHGTGIEPSSQILTDMFKRSVDSGYQFGKGVYFTDLLDYAWYYGGKTNRNNLNKIPKVDQNFILVGSYIYYDKNGCKRVYDHKYTPKKNEMNYAFADSETKTIKEYEPDKKKFYGTEYLSIFRLLIKKR